MTSLSLRDNPEVEGRYIINYGHRRYRASRVKRMEVVPAFIDNDYDNDDQMIENIQREGQSPREIAERIGRKEVATIMNKDIVARWGKSAAWVTQHATLLDLPEPIHVDPAGRDVVDALFHADTVSSPRRRRVRLLNCTRQRSFETLCQPGHGSLC